MTYSLNVIYDGIIGGDNEIKTLPFKHSPILIISFPDNSYEGYIAGYLSTIFTGINTVEEKDILLDKFLYNYTNLNIETTLEDLSITPLWDSSYIYTIPFELINSELELYLRLNLGINTNTYNIRIYALQTNATNDLLKEDIEAIKEKLAELETLQITDLALQGTSVAQNALMSTGLSVVSTGLLPVTGGVSSGALPFFSGAALSGASNGLLPLLPAL